MQHLEVSGTPVLYRGRKVLKGYKCIKVLSPTDAQENCFKRSIKIYIKTAPTCFGVITTIRDGTILAC